MSMPKDFGFGAEELMLRDAARKFFRTNFPTDRLHRLVAGDPEPNRSPECLWDRDLWAQLTELGWTSLAVPARAGGIGMSCVAVAALVEEAGRAAFPSPLVATIHATFLLDACATAAADEERGSAIGSCHHFDAPKARGRNVAIPVPNAARCSESEPTRPP